MLGWFFSGHPIIDVTNSLSPLFRRPNWVRRRWGFRYPTLGLAHVHLEPVSPSTVACSSSTQGTVGRTSRGRGGLAPTCGAWLTTLVGSGCLSTLLGCCGHSVLAGVASHPPWLRMGSCLPPLGAG